MDEPFNFDNRIMGTVIAGHSALEVPQLDLRSREEASEFIKTYGYDFQREGDKSRAWNIHRRAVAFLKDNLLVEGEEIPEEIYEPSKLVHIERLLLFASEALGENKTLQKWACVVLRVMHAHAHLENDLFNVYSREIQQQILKPFQDCIWIDPAIRATTLGRKKDSEQIKLQRFDIKPDKSVDSAIIKLLAKPNLTASSLLDKVGVRFVTRSIFDAFRVIRFLVEENVISFAHIMPDQANNTLYPTRLFFETMKQLEESASASTSSDEIHEILNDRLQKFSKEGGYLDKENLYSSHKYKFIKFIARKLIHIESKDNQGEEKGLNFFYPFEVQIVDYETYLNNLSGSASHDKYKERQKRAARLRAMLGRVPKSTSTGAQSGEEDTNLF